MRRAATTLALAFCGLLYGCGNALPDLFIVQRSGSIPGARLTLLVNEGGTVRCNGGPPLKLSEPALIQARALQEELKEPAGSHLKLPPRPGSVLSYHVRDENGTVDFADNSTGKPKVLRNMALWVLQTAQGTCHLPL
jgi:hypothetical protein